MVASLRSGDFFDMCHFSEDLKETNAKKPKLKHKK